ncbi:MAG TPA: winged helix-turn-helix transcriptional regulator [Candidatus Wunengus sp. YC60]|uniref:winged helix-turn-helix transcriptional regulator n=1 Tax=Candidatus Wunengus sp. YC60 TaxID=3367697 RepID=UPI0040268909
MANQEEITQYNILQSIENGEQISQRQLSSQLGINVASINFALKKLTKRGFVKMLGANPRRMQYILTPKGIAEKTQIAYKFFDRNFHFYKAVRKDVEDKIGSIPFDEKKRVAIYGVTDLMEIAYLVIQDKELELVAIVDDETKIRIFGYHVIGSDELTIYSPDFLLLTKEFDAEKVKQIPDYTKVVDIRL